MRARLVVLAAALGILALQWTREPGLSLAPPDPEAGGSGEPVSPSGALAEPAPWPAGARNPFRYEGPAPGEGRTERPAMAPAEVTPPPEPPVRLVGLVRRSGRVQAALAADGEVVLASVGDPVGAFTVMSLDPDGSVRLRARDGSVLTLTLPEPR